MATNWAAIAVNVTQSYLSMSEAYDKSKIIDAEAKLNQTLAGIEANQLERQAIAAENVGVRAAQIEQYKTRVVSSDATAAMAAGGAVLDPEMLAKIKQRGDYNSMSAIFDARSRAIDLRYEASMTRTVAGYRAGAAGRYGDSLRREATTGAVFNSMDLFAQAYKPKKAGVSRPAGYDYRKVASQGKAQGRGGYS
jgi:hypothetical protein